MRMRYYESLAIEHKESMGTKLICLLLVFATLVASAMNPVFSTHQLLDKSWTNSISAKSQFDFHPKSQAIPEIGNSGSDRFVLEPVLRLESSNDVRRVTNPSNSIVTSQVGVPEPVS